MSTFTIYSGIERIHMVRECILLFNGRRLNNSQIDYQSVQRDPSYLHIDSLPLTGILSAWQLNFNLTMTLTYSSTKTPLRSRVYFASKL